MITIRKCNLEDLNTLHNISCGTYEETFSHLNSETNMQAFLESAYNIDKLQRELLCEHSSFYFLYMDEILAGYMKLNVTPAQTDIHDDHSLELERIYLLKEFKGKGLAQHLMNKVLETAIEYKKQYVWLGVWENNEHAKHFYQNNGFYQIGQHPFVMGDDIQTDLILRKDLIS